MITANQWNGKIVTLHISQVYRRGILECSFKPVTPFFVGLWCSPYNIWNSTWYTGRYVRHTPQKANGFPGIAFAGIHVGDLGAQIEVGPGESKCWRRAIALFISTRTDRQSGTLERLSPFRKPGHTLSVCCWAPCAAIRLLF